MKESFHSVAQCYPFSSLFLFVWGQVHILPIPYYSSPSPISDENNRIRESSPNHIKNTQDVNECWPINGLCTRRKHFEATENITKLT